MSALRVYQSEKPCLHRQVEKETEQISPNPG